MELWAFNIHVILTHSGEMATPLRIPFTGKLPMKELKEEYKSTTAEFVAQVLRARAGKELADPSKAASQIVEAVDQTGMLHMIAGNDYSRRPLGGEDDDAMRQRGFETAETIEGFDGIYQSVDFKGHVITFRLSTLAISSG